MSSATAKHSKGPPEIKPKQEAGPFLTTVLDSSVGSKILVALTGVGLTTFAVFHMIGNLKMFQGHEAINGYAYFLKHNLGILIWIARIGLLTIFVLHLVLAIRLKLRSQAARPIPYQFKAVVQASLASRTMIWTGIVVGLFILFHLAHFTFGWVTQVEVSPGKSVSYLELQDPLNPLYQDVYSMVVAGFRNPVISALYILAQLALFVHLSHGVQSAFQTLGLKNRRFTWAIKLIGFAVAAFITVGNIGIVLAVWGGVVPPIPLKG